MIWAEPFWLILLIFAPLPWLLSRRTKPIPWPSLDGLNNGTTLRSRIKAVLPFVLRGLLIASLALALARPRSIGGQTRIAGRGVAILVAIDHSSSMKATDFPNSGSGEPITRLEAAKITVTQFVEKRSDDLVGLIVFANYPDLACPLTLDHVLLLDIVRSIRPVRASDDGTNLGDALIRALEAIKLASPKKKVLILLTDGRNSPAVPQPTNPEFAADLASRYGVTVHTIGIGNPGRHTSVVEPLTKLPIQGEVDGPDVEALERIAELGGGRSFVAADSNALTQVFDRIDVMEKSPVRGEIRTRYNELFAPFAAVALILLVLDRCLSARWLRSLP